MSEVSNVVAMPGPTAAALRIQETGVLLERPTYQRPPHHDVVYALMGGRVGTAPLARYRLPKSLRAHTLVVPDSGDADTQARLPELAALADRIAPWVAVHLVPRILSRRNGDDDYGRHAGHYDVDSVHYSAVGGLACYDEQLILLNSAGPTAVTTTLCHELMHFMWHRLSDAAQAVLKEAVDDGADWPGNYFGNTEERVARMFEKWSSARVEGMPHRGAVIMTPEGIFEHIWSGALADHQIQLGLVPNHETLRIRRSLPELPPPVPEAIEPEASPKPQARIDDVVCDWIWDGAAALVRLVGRGIRLAVA